MRSLYFAPHPIWPLDTGARLRDYHLARQLAAEAEVTFVEMCSATEKGGTASEVAGWSRVLTLQKDQTYTPRKLVKGLVGPVPVTILNCWSPSAASKLAAVLRSGQFDTVQIEGVHLMEYLPIIQKCAGRAGIIVDWHNIESEMMRRYANSIGNWTKKVVALRTATLIERAEDRLLDACVTHTVTSERERKKLLARRPGADIQVIPNGVDLRYFGAVHGADADQAYARRTVEQTSNPVLLFVGSMDYHANVAAVNWFSRTAWPELARKYPDLQFKIVGRNPTREVRALASQRIQVTGAVDDVRPFYTSAVAAVVPLRSGSGTRLKILEAMAAGVPVVSTAIGAEGLEIEHDVHLLIANEPHEIVAAVGKLTCSPELRLRLARTARVFVRDTHDWSAIGQRLRRIHVDAVKSHTARLFRKVS